MSARKKLFVKHLSIIWRFSSGVESAVSAALFCKPYIASRAEYTIRWSCCLYFTSIRALLISFMYFSVRPLMYFCVFCAALVSTPTSLYISVKAWFCSV